MLYPKVVIPNRPERNLFGRVFCRTTLLRSKLMVKNLSWARTPDQRTMDRLSDIRRVVADRRGPRQKRWGRWGWGGILGQLWLAECRRLDGYPPI